MTAERLELYELPDHNRPVSPEEPSTLVSSAASSSSLTAQITLLLQSQMIAPQWRRPVGLFLLLATLSLWTASSFLASSIFADASFSKPYFVTYFNIAFFILPLLPFALQEASASASRQRSGFDAMDHGRKDSTTPILGPSAVEEAFAQHQGAYQDRRDANDEQVRGYRSVPPSEVIGHTTTHMTNRETFILGVKFSLLWFISNYFSAASLQYTTVASTTILSSTSSVFTLVLGALWRVEKFSWKKLGATVTCLLGVFIISRADTTGEDGERGRFPYKSPAELLLGDAMALIAAFLYGFYAVAFVKTVGDESRVKMPLFFGYIGIVSTGLLWPGLFILHWTGVETFELPPNGHVWAIIIINAVASLVADIAWAYSLLFISPLVVTVGLSLSIPLSLVGQMILDGQYASMLYWLGAVIVLVSFVFINFESNLPQEQAAELAVEG